MMASFYYHFWVYAWPKIGRTAESDPRLLINQTLNTSEGIVNLACIATGIFQILSI